jgi:hypothetical protein
VKRIAREALDRDTFIPEGNKLTKNWIMNIPRLNLFSKTPRKADGKWGIKQQLLLVCRTDMAKIHHITY